MTRRRAWLLVPALPLLAAAAVVLVPQGRLGCTDPYREESPDGAWSLSVCPRPLWFAMPGQGGDAPGWIVLRDRAGAIRGVSDLDMVQAYGASGLPTEWRADGVEKPLTVEFPLLPAPNGAARWLEDRLWRLRARLGLVPNSADFR